MIKKEHHVGAGHGLDQVYLADPENSTITHNTGGFFSFFFVLVRRLMLFLFFLFLYARCMKRFRSHSQMLFFRLCWSF